VQLELATGATNGIHVGDYFEFGNTIIHSDRIFPLNGENGMRRKFDFFPLPFVNQAGYTFLFAFLTGYKA
jgi:hypothetical protein